MHTPVLITGKEIPFREDLVQEYLNRSIPVFLTVDPERPDDSAELDSRITSCPWAPRSVLSGRSMIVAAERQAEGFESAVVVCGPEGINTAVHATESAVIEERLDASLKGYYFVIREILASFLRRRTGDLTVLWFDGGTEVLPPFDACLSGAVHALVDSLMVYYDAEPVTIRGLNAAGGESREVARWAMEMIVDRRERSAGRWQRFGQRGGILPFRKG